MTIRVADLPRDLPALVALQLEANPTAVVSAASLAQRIAAVPERARLVVLVAESAGAVVARAEVFLDWFDTEGDKAVCNVAVAAAERRRGIGTALLEAGLDRLRPLGPATVLADYVESDAGNGFAVRHRFREVRAEQLSTLDPRTVAEAPPSTVRLRAVADLDPRLVHLVDEEATGDMPATGTFESLPYDEWRQHVLEHPLFAADGSFVAFVGGEPAALSLLTADAGSGRGSNMFTGTRRAFRGRGLALAVKLATTRWAAANGIVQLATTNDETNAPMLAINRRLGYRPVGRRVEVARPLD